MMLLLLKNNDDLGSVISDGTLAERGGDVQMRLPTATESAVTPYVTILAASAASALKPTACNTVFGLVPMVAATATAVHRIHRCAWRGRLVHLEVYVVAPAVVNPANSDRRDFP